MAIVFFEGFENKNLIPYWMQYSDHGNGYGWDTGYNNGTCLKINAISSYSYYYAIVINNNQNFNLSKFILGFRFKTTQFPSNYDNYLENRFICHIEFTPNFRGVFQPGFFYYYYDYNGSYNYKQINFISSIQTNKWYYIEFEVDFYNNFVKMYKNGAYQGSNTVQQDPGSFDYVCVANKGEGGYNYFDDIYVIDQETEPNTERFGPVIVKSLLPIEDTATKNITEIYGGTHPYEVLDDPDYPNDTDWIKLSPNEESVLEQKYQEQNYDPIETYKIIATEYQVVEINDNSIESQYLNIISETSITGNPSFSANLEFKNISYDSNFKIYKTNPISAYPGKEYLTDFKTLKSGLKQEEI